MTTGLPPEVLIAELIARRRQFALHVTGVRLAAGVTALVGPNGAGKTTLLEVLAGRVRAAPRRVMVGSRPLGDADVALMPQKLELPRDVSVRALLEHVAWLSGAARSEARERADRLTDELALTGKADSPISSLSGGMSRRVGFGAARSQGGRLLLLDEPTNDLDPEQRRELLGAIATCGRAQPVVVSTHGLRDVLDVADAVLVLHEGRVIHHGAVSEFLTRFAPDTSDAEEAYIACLSRSRNGPGRAAHA